MTVQIAVRLPEDMVEFVDRLVAAGEAPSRASVLERALAREIRRHAAEQDAAILADAGPDPELAGLAEYAARVPGGLA
jgi:Arc/MetJ-type ribon-helix-helix transcriptional regulator